MLKNQSIIYYQNLFKMGKVISNPKNYSGQDLEQIFFRPMLSGPDAVELGVKIMYNMPVPTTLNFWRRATDLLQKYAKGWNGSEPADKFQKQISLSKVKAELGYSADEYFSMVWEKIAVGADVNMQDLSGTELEAAETELFRGAIAESIRATMWLGDTARGTGFNTFDGFFKRIKADVGSGSEAITSVAMTTMAVADNAEKLFQEMLDAAPDALRDMKSDKNLVFLVTRNVYENYENTLTTGNLESVRNAKIDGIERLFYKGIPVIDIKVDSYLAEYGSTMPQSWAILSDRRNLAVAVNTSDYPGSEVSMWYNPDEMENRQRAVFAAGCDYLLPELIVASYSAV